MQTFKEASNWNDAYIINESDYKKSNTEVELAISKENGVGKKFEFTINLTTGKISYKGYEGSENSESTETVNDIDNEEQDANIEENIDPEFYACDDDGNRIEGFDNLFDKNIETYVDRYTSQTIKIRWNRDIDITGKQIYVKTNGSSYGDFFIKYINDAGEVLNTYTSYYTSTTYLNYNGGDSITYVPEGATALLLQDWESQNFYEIELFENGNNTDNLISNVKVKGVTSNKVTLKWTQDSSVTEVKVYKDGNYIGTSNTSEYLVSDGLMNNKTYIFYLEPITDSTTDNYKNKKVKLNVKTLKDSAGFYIENVDEIGSKFYDNWFDGNLDTFLDRNSSATIKVKWTENITGKQMRVKTTGGSASDFYVKYIDDNGNVVSANTPSGSTENYLNYNSGESVTFVPENATGLLIQDWESQQICEIGTFEDGMYGTNHITNVKASNIDKHSIDLSWNKTDSVIKTIIYIDGVYYAETEGSSYTIDTGLLSNTEYIYTLEPVTSNTTDVIKNKKTSAKYTTKSDGVDFYVDGTNNTTRKLYKEWFDGDKNTYIKRSTSETKKIKWTGDITGKQIYVKTNGGKASDFYIKYIDDDGNVINTNTPSGLDISYLNYNNGESVTYVPKGATGLLLQDWESQNFYEIGLFEEGKYLESKITNVKVSDVTQHSMKLSWQKKSDVIKTKVYQDGEYIGETEENEYIVNQGIISNTEYIYYLEPIVNEEDTATIKKGVIKVKTLSDGVDFQVEGTSDISKRYYKYWFDNDDNTCIVRYTSETKKIKWTGNITGKKILVKTNGGYVSDFWIKYVDDDNNVISANTPSGTTVGYLNYNNGESVTYVPEGATGLLLQDWESQNFYEIKVVE